MRGTKNGADLGLGNVSLFDVAEETAAALTHGRRLDVVRADFLGAETLSWEELFQGYDRLRAITYSSGIDFVCGLLGLFGDAEIIFGFEDVLSYTLQEIIAYQTKTIERLRDKASKSKTNLISRIDDGSLRLFVARKQLSHEKIYILDADDGRKRVITGSANMSRAAFSGVQRENICYMDGDAAFDWYLGVYEQLRNDSADSVISKMLIADMRVDNAENAANIEELPIAQTVKVKKALVVEPVADEETRAEIRFVLDVKGLAGKIANFMPKAEKNGAVKLSPEKIKTTRRLIEDAATQEKELRSEYPQLVVDIFSQSATLNCTPLNLNPSTDEIENDVALFLEYMNGYEKFHGDVHAMQLRYYEFANWFFVSPFMAQLRQIAAQYNQALLPYPVFGLVYGQSKAGKTSFLETLLKMMIGQKPKISAPDFTRSSIERLKQTIQGAPIIVDDLTQDRFGRHAVETIKNDAFGVSDSLKYYPVVVISANEDVKAVAQEVIRRTVICRVQAGLKNTELMKSRIVRRVQSGVGTAFYREYLRRMLDKLPTLADELKSDDAQPPDVLAESSRVLLDILNEYGGGAAPFYARELALDDYFGEKVTGANVIKKIQDAWRINKKSFKVDKKMGQLMYSVGGGNYYEADRILKELPEDLEAHKSHEWVIMDLERACDFFGVNFKKLRIFG